MRQVLRVLACVVGLGGCGGDDSPPPVTDEDIDRCSRLIDIVSAQLVDCKALIGDVPATWDIMYGIRDRMMVQCTRGDFDDVTDLDELEATPCSVICSDVPDGCAP